MTSAQAGPAPTASASAAEHPFITKLLARQRWAKSVVCAGLDPDKEKVRARLPSPLGWLERISDPSLIEGYTLWTIDEVASIAAAIKPNAGFFRRFGSVGLAALERIIKYLQTRYPGIPIILDYKCEDIGASAANYAEEAVFYGVDAVTVGPYFGIDSVGEFLKRGLFVFVLCRTSNPTNEVQNMVMADGRQLFLPVAEKIVEWRKTYPGCGLVVGATKAEDFPPIIAITGAAPLLIPAFGKKQGGKAEDIIPVVAPSGAKAADRLILCNVSSEAMFNPDGKPPAQAIGEFWEKANKLLPLHYCD